MSVPGYIQELVGYSRDALIARCIDNPAEFYPKLRRMTRRIEKARLISSAQSKHATITPQLSTDQKRLPLYHQNSVKWFFSNYTESGSTETTVQTYTDLRTNANDFIE